MQDTSQKSGQFDFTEILAIVWRRKWLIVIPVILVTAVTIAGSYMITPMYESAVIISVGNKMNLTNDLQRLLGQGGQGYRSQMDRQMELRSLQNEITSSPYISELVLDLQLDQDPLIDEEAKKIQLTAPNIELDKIKFDILLERLRNSIGVSYVGQNQIQIVTQSKDRHMSRDMAKTLGEVFISKKTMQEMGLVRESQDFTYEQLSKYEKDLEEKISAKTEFEIEFNKIRIGDDIISEQNRRDIQSEISSTRQEIDDKKGDERQLLNQLSGSVGNSPSLEASDELKSLRRQIKNHQRDLTDLTEKYTWSASEILNHKARLYNMIQDVEDENLRLVNDQYVSSDSDVKDLLTRLFNAREELDILYNQVNYLSLSHSNLKSKIDLFPQYQANIDQLDREIVAARDLRDKFKEQDESAQISQALLRESKYKVIEPAKVPLDPFKPKKKQIVVLGFLLGIAIGGAAALLSELLDKSFRKVEEIESALGLPVIGVIPQIESVKKLKIKK